MAKQIVWTLKAKNELIEILDYWNHRNKSTIFSVKLYGFIDEQLNLISKYPTIGRMTDVNNVYVKVIQKYLLYYEIIDDTLFVLTIRHGSKNLKTLKLK